MKTKIFGDVSEVNVLDQILVVDEDGNFDQDELDHWSAVAARLVDSDGWQLLRLVIVGRIEQAKSITASRSTNVDEWRYEQGAEAALEEIYNYVINLSQRTQEDENEV